MSFTPQMLSIGAGGSWLQTLRAPQSGQGADPNLDRAFAAYRSPHAPFSRMHP